MARRLQLAILLGQLLYAAGASASGSPQASYHAQLRIAHGRRPAQDVGPPVGSAADASAGKWGKIADFFADVLAPFTSLVSKAARYFAPGQGWRSLASVDELYQSNFVVSALTFLILAMISALFALYYVNHKPRVFAAHPSSEIFTLSDWKASDIVCPGSWLTEKQICLCSCCCPCIRWADTISMLGLMRFWSAFFIFLIISYLHEISGGSLVWWLALVLLCTYERQQIRKIFGMPRGTFGTIAADCCCYCWCLPCTIAQEARHVEKAVRNSVWAGTRASG